MRKLSILVALILCVTIGGVYATWSYPGADVADGHHEVVVELEQATLGGSSGSYAIESNLRIGIDQTGVGDYSAKLLFQSANSDDPYIKLTFTPSDLAPDDVKANGLDSEFYLVTTTDMQYNGDDIFTFSNPSDGTFTKNVTWTKEGNSFTCTYNLADIEEMITLSKDFVLDTKAKYDEFSAALAGNIKLCLTDGTVNSSQG
ncbi:MAG: hypothetical protein E7634_00660 [Ruminococcaceae bacterium]|nr:hypothetical protein [Oscillospiraceae bacterium]